MLYAKIKADYMSARKAGNDANSKVLKALLSTFIGELTTAEKSGVKIDDASIVKKARVYISNIESYISNYSDEAKVSANIELEYLNSLIPQQLTEAEIKLIVSKYDAIGPLMAYMKSNYAGRYDGSLVNRLFSSK